MSKIPSKNKMSLLMLTASVAGNMMGSGIFLLPTTLAEIGSISIFGWIVSLLGSYALALVFAKLSMIMPKAGGPYAYTRASYGNYLGFQTAFLYWIGSWIGNIAVAIVMVGYLSFFFPVLKHPLTGCFTGIAIIWFFTILNLFGPRFMGRVQIFTTSVLLIPILGTAIFGWFWFDKSIFLSGFRVHDIGTFDAITRSAAMTLWAFIGVETACVNAGVVENPSKTVPLATLLGLTLAGSAYVLSSAVIMGIIPVAQLAQSSSPFSLFASTILGPKAGAFVSICAIIGCAGTISGWTLVTGQISKAAADDNQFPTFLGRINKYNAPHVALIFTGILIAVIFLLTLAPTVAKHFAIISATGVFVVVLPYLYACLSLFIILKSDTQAHQHRIFYGFAAVTGALFSWWAIYGLGETIIFYGSLTIFLTALFFLYPALKKPI